MKEKDAKDFFYRHKIPSFIVAHTEAVVIAAKIIAKHEGLNVEEAGVAAWLHDVGYAINKEKHAQHSCEMVKQFHLSEQVVDAILNHSRSANPKTALGRVMQKADKLSFANPAMLEILYRDNPAKLGKFLRIASSFCE